MMLINSKKWLAIAAICLFTVCLSGASAAEEPPKVTGAFDIKDSFQPGGEVKAQLELKIAKGFHINCDPDQNPIGMPLHITLDADKILELKEVICPKASKVKLAFSKDPAPVFEDEARFTIVLKAASDAAKGKYKGKLVVEYQGCDDNVCHMPDLLELPFEYEVK